MTIPLAEASGDDPVGPAGPVAITGGSALDVAVTDGGAPQTGAALVDWDLAIATGVRLVRPGPAIPLAEAVAVVAELRERADEAEGHVAAFTGLSSADDHPPTSIVDRPDWIRANVGGFQAMLAPLLDRMADRRGGGAPTGAVVAVGSRVSGVQVGAVLAYLAGKVLGQYEVFLPPEAGSGRLTLVAPNIVAAERALQVDPHDFRLWVCLHEVTHRTQFTAVPWLREHVRSEVGALLAASDLDAGEVLRRLAAAARAVTGALAGRAESASLVEAMQTPEQRVVTDRLTALMSLLEGHGDYVMDGVGPAVVPSVAEIRRKFSARRAGGGSADRLVRRLFGLDLKMQQYERGESFVRGVIERVGMDGFNRVWESPLNLPTTAELADPDGWARRVVRGGLAP